MADELVLELIIWSAARNVTHDAGRAKHSAVDPLLLSGSRLILTRVYNLNHADYCTMFQTLHPRQPRVHSVRSLDQRLL